jgi:cytochrome c oxidase subunit IV
MATEAVAGHAAVHTEPNYIAVFIYLAILTGIELAIYAMGLPKVFKISLLIALAWAKAVMVAMYFMHLAMERRGLWIIAITPVVLITFLCFMLLPDLTTRMWTHYDHRINVTNPALEGANPVAPAPEAAP